MNDLQIFNSEEFGSLRTIVLDNEPWFVAKDITDRLGYSNGRDAVLRIVDDEDKRIIQKSEIPTLEISNRGLTFINESGLYALVLSSKLPSAKKFRRWITSEVIPSIRKTGTYKTPQTFSEALRLAADLQEEKEKLEIANKELEAEKERNAPKVLFADSVTASDSSILVRELAKLLKQNGYETGEQRLYDQLRREGYICRNSTEPTQKAMELGLFERTVRTVQRGDYNPLETTTTRVTGKGQQYFINRYLKKILEKKSKTGKVYFGCENNPKCDFMTWDVPVFVGNDANCASLGEFYAGAASGKHSALFSYILYIIMYICCCDDANLMDYFVSSQRI